MSSSVNSENVDTSPHAEEEGHSPYRCRSTASHYVTGLEAGRLGYGSTSHEAYVFLILDGGLAGYVGLPVQAIFIAMEKAALLGYDDEVLASYR